MFRTQKIKRDPLISLLGSWIQQDPHSMCSESKNTLFLLSAIAHCRQQRSLRIGRGRGWRGSASQWQSARQNHQDHRTSSCWGPEGGWGGKIWAFRLVWRAGGRRHGFWLLVELFPARIPGKIFDLPFFYGIMCARIAECGPESVSACSNGNL